MDLFSRQRELCMLFKSQNEKAGVKIDYSISNKSFNIVVFHGESCWDVEKGRNEINKP